VWRVGCWLVLVGCGRIGFAEHNASDDAMGSGDSNKANSMSQTKVVRPAG